MALSYLAYFQGIDMETMVKFTEIDFGSKKDKQFILRVRNSQREII